VHGHAATPADGDAVATLLPAADGLAVMPLVIVAVVVAYVVTARREPLPAEDAAQTPAPAATPEAVPTGSR